MGFKYALVSLVNNAIRTVFKCTDETVLCARTALENVVILAGKRSNANGGRRLYK